MLSNYKPAQNARPTQGDGAPCGGRAANKPALTLDLQPARRATRQDSRLRAAREAGQEWLHVCVGVWECVWVCFLPEECLLSLPLGWISATFRALLQAPSNCCPSPPPSCFDPRSHDNIQAASWLRRGDRRWRGSPDKYAPFILIRRVFVSEGL